MVALAGTAPSFRESNAKCDGAPLATLYRSHRSHLAELSRNVNRESHLEQRIGAEAMLVPGRGLEPRYSAPKADVLPIRRSRNRPNSVADARKCAQERPIHRLLRPTQIFGPFP